MLSIIENELISTVLKLIQPASWKKYDQIYPDLIERVAEDSDCNSLIFCFFLCLESETLFFSEKSMATIPKPFTA